METGGRDGGPGGERGGVHALVRVTVEGVAFDVSDVTHRDSDRGEPVGLPRRGYELTLPLDTAVTALGPQLALLDGWPGLAALVTADPRAAVHLLDGPLFDGFFEAVLPGWDGAEPPRLVIDGVVSVRVEDGTLRLTGLAYRLG